MENSTADLQAACTLQTEAWPGRREWIANLNRSALIGARREGMSLALADRPEHAVRVRELVRSERRCCAVLSFDREEAGEELTLAIGLPENAADDIDAIPAPFTATAAEAGRCGCNPASERKGNNNVCD